MLRTAGWADVIYVQEHLALLHVLAANAGSLLSYERLLPDVWGRGYENSREYVRIYVGRLRSKLDDAEVEPLILTEPRAGYRLIRPNEPI